MGERHDVREGNGSRAAALAALLLLSIGCATSPRQPADSGASTPAASSASQPASTPAEIRGLDLVERGETASVTVRADRQLVWTNYRDRDGNLVLELPNTVPAAGVTGPVTGSGLVASVEVERLDDSERPMTRLVVHTRRDSELALDAEGTNLHLELQPVGYEEPVALAYEPIEQEDAPPPAVAAPPVPRATTPAGTPEAPYVAPAPRGVAASRLVGVDVVERGEEVVVAIAGDGEFAYSTFRLENPERFVVDLSGVVNTSPRSTIPVGAGAPVQQIRVGQFKPRPDPVSRVVFDLGETVTPSIERSSDGLTVVFHGGERMAAAPPASRPPAAAPPPAVVAERAPPEDDFVADEPEASPYVGTADEQGPVVAETTAEAAASPPPPVLAPPVETLVEAEDEMDELDEMGGMDEMETDEAVVTAAAPPRVPVFEPAAPPAPSVSRPVGTSDVALFEAQEVRVAPGAQVTEEEVFPQFETLVVSRSDREYVGEPISMSLRNADLVETLRSFAKFSDLNFVIQPGVSGTVTVELNAVPWDQALEQILKINNLGMDIDGTIVRIAPLDQLRAEAEQQRQILASRQQAVPLKTVMKRLSYARAAEVAGLLRNRQGSLMSARGTVQVDTRTNTLLIRELPTSVDTVLAVIENLDIPEPQVMIEARIIEATKTFSRSLGIEWGFDGVADQAHGNTTGLVFPNNIEADGGVGLLTGGNNGFLNFSLGNILDTFTLDAAIQAAEAEGLVNIISAPRVTTLNNSSASIQSGLQIPIQTVTNRTVSVQFVNATLQLQVTPQVTAEGTIVLTINVAKKSPQPALAVVGASNAPIATKEAQTKVVVRDGATTVIGGIYEVSANQGQDRVPGLANIPILGHLFKNRSREDSNDELMIFITPRIVQM